MRTKTNFDFHFRSVHLVGCSIEFSIYRPYGIAWQLYDAQGQYCAFCVGENIAPNNVENLNIVPS